MFHNDRNDYTKKTSSFRKVFAIAIGCVAAYAIIFGGSDIDEDQKVRLTTAEVAKDEPKSAHCCNDFFGTLAPWAGKGGKTCATILTNDMYNRLMVVNSKMQEFDTYYTMYIDYSISQEENALCYDEILRPELGLDRIKIEDYSAKQLLTKYGFDNDDIGRVKAINGMQGKSDVMRLVLAAEYGQTYMDTDVIILSDNYEDFKKPFVGMAVWGENSASLEMTNSVFCLPKEVLTKSLDTVKQIMIGHGDRGYFDQELGSSLFQKTVTNHADHPVHIYAVNHPQIDNVPSISESYDTYGFKLMHLTTRIRLGEVCFIVQVNNIRKALDFEELDLMPMSHYNLTMTAEHYL